MPLYQYNPLRRFTDLRLVYLHPASKVTESSDDSDASPTITIDIREGQMGCSNYTALSYVWGDPNRSEDLEVLHSGSRSVVKITKSLQTALRYLRGSQTKVLWIDAICINQDDVKERNKQVTKMGEIYSKASDVIIWLGEENYDSDLAMKFIPEISVQGLDQLAGRQSTGESWKALARLMRRPWFTRRWIIQEVAFSQKAELWCGESVVSWMQFAEAVTLFESKIDDINQLFRDLKKSEKSNNTLKKIASYAVPVAVFAGGVAIALASRGAFKPQKWIGPLRPGVVNAGRKFEHDMGPKYIWNYEFPIGQVRGVGAHSLVTTLDRIIRTRPGQQNPDRLCTIEELISYLPTFQAGEALDTVFAIASLSKDYLNIIPDYGNSLAFVCKEVINSTVSSTGSLNIICRPWAPTTPNIPSWISQLSNHPFAQDSEGIYVRRGADCLVGHPGRCPYKASGQTRISKPFDHDGKPFTLVAKGFRIGGTYNYHEAAKDGIVPASWVQRSAGSIMNSDGVVKEAFWRTLIGDRDEQGGPAPSWMRRACEEIYKENGHGDLDTKKLLEVKADQTVALSSNMKSFLKRVQAVTWNRRIIVKDEEPAGLIPADARKDDHVCVLFGCDVPVLLRRHEAECGTWELVGEVYFHGIMDGEAMSRSYEEETFLLV